MSILDLAKLYGLMAAAFFAIDLVWLGVVARDFYRNNIGHLMADSPLWPAAFAFYAIYLAGIMVFAVLPGLEAQSLSRTVALGAFLGFFAYATFDLTSMAVLKDFPLNVVLVDLAWGTILTGSVAAAGYFAGRWMGLA